MSNPTFSILITTKNRKVDLGFTLNEIQHLLNRKDVVCIICDDGSSDGTSNYIKTNYPEIQLLQHPISRGYIYSRNRLLRLVNTAYAISLDDDAHFITSNPLECISNFFELNPDCGLVALRIFWGLQQPGITISSTNPCQVQGFVGCAHVWRMSAWKDIPDYPEWFVFYGEEDFASFHLFKKKWKVFYLPEVLVHHRADNKARKKNKDYMQRQRRSLRSGWYLLFLFYPIGKILREFTYSLWIQLKTKVFKGDFKVLQAIVIALLDLVCNMPRILKCSNRLTPSEYDSYIKLPEAKIYWQPELKTIKNEKL